MKPRNLAVLVRDVTLVALGTVGAAFGFLVLVFLRSSFVHLLDRPASGESVALDLLAPILYAITGVVLMIVPILIVGAISGVCGYLISQSSLGPRTAQLVGGVLGAAGGTVLCTVAHMAFGPGMDAVPIALAPLIGLAAAYGFLLGFLYIYLCRKGSRNGSPNAMA